MKKYLTASLLFISLAGSSQNLSLTNDDLKPMAGCWEGTITYLDYSSGKPFTMPANLVITPLKEGVFLLSNIYPKEPKANSTDTLRLTSGNTIDGEKIISKYRNEEEELVVVTEGNGFDGNDHKPAIFHHTYIIGKKRFLHKKEVQFKGEPKWIKRNEFSYASAICQ